MLGILQAEVENEWTVDPVVERQAVMIALKKAEVTGRTGDFRITTSVNGMVEVVYVKVYHG